MLRWVFVFVGGGLGSIMRYQTGLWMTDLFGGAFPYGTLTVNVSGSFLIGLLATLADERGLITPTARLFLVVGLLGGFTTFSSFSLETFRLAREGEMTGALLNVLGNLALSFVCVWLGAGLGRVVER